MGIELKAQGDVFAVDGWRMAWNLDTTPQQIDVWNADGVPQYTISGEMDQQYVERKAKAFLQEHSGQGKLF